MQLVRSSSGDAKLYIGGGRACRGSKHQLFEKVRSLSFGHMDHLSGLKGPMAGLSIRNSRVWAKLTGMAIPRLPKSKGCPQSVVACSHTRVGVCPQGRSHGRTWGGPRVHSCKKGHRVPLEGVVVFGARIILRMYGAAQLCSSD